ncbi:MAG: N-acetylmannosamine-6-phosphate 2-epimerase [Clostridia bacterium]|nr:N-acetylmannosamine-6-phosphate 2-epimerase [Clostridia bacterium]
MKHGEYEAPVLDRLQGGLIVSCQAMYSDSPTNSPAVLCAMAAAACRGGACGIRANRPENIRAVRSAVAVPLIGLFKDSMPGHDVYITPTFEHARLVAEAGADIVALDGTARPHPGELDMATVVRRIHEDLGKLVMLDISTYEEGLEAEGLGADIVSTTLAGYTAYSRQFDGPDLDLVVRLSAACRIPVVAEGRFEHPDQVRVAMQAGAFAVVVGRAITDPEHITASYVEAANTWKARAVK